VENLNKSFWNWLQQEKEIVSVGSVQTNDWNVVWWVRQSNALLSRLYITCVYGRGYWMIYWGPGFLAVAWFGFLPLSVSKLHRRHTGRPWKRDKLLTGGGKRGARSRIRPQVSLFLCKSFNTLCCMKQVGRGCMDLNNGTRFRAFFRKLLEKTSWKYKYSQKNLQSKSLLKCFKRCK
jgi:hypothetical protein